MLILDVDGVLTDGGVYLGGREETKRFDVRDGTGIKYLMRSGVDVAMISGRASEANAAVARELGIAELHQNALRKWPVVEEMLQRRGLEVEKVAYMGDDLMDLPVMIRVGLALAPADAAPEARERAHAVTDRPGGHGAVREVADALLRAQGVYDDLVNGYLSRS